MKKPFLVASAVVVTLFFADTALAQSTAQDVAAGINTFSGLITLITTTVVKSAGTLILSLGVVAFFYGVVKYIWGLRNGDTNETKNGQQFMIWGLVGLFVMFSVYGIIKFGQGILFNGKDITTITIPDINLKNSGSGSPVGNPTGGSGSQGSPVGTPLGGGGNQTGTPVGNPTGGAPQGDVPPEVP